MKRLSIAILTLAATLTLAAGEEVVKRGAELSTQKSVPLATVLETPAKYTESAVVVDGVIEAACERQGCWMQLAPKAGEPGVRVTFKDYAFFIPLDARGMTAKVEGVTSIKVLSKADVDHLESEGAKLKRNEDGSANEVSIVATGVELRRQ